MSETNPEKSLDALLTVFPLTLGKLALLEKMDSPLLDRREKVNLIDLAESVYILTLPFPVALDEWQRKETERNAFMWLDTVGTSFFIKRLEEACDALADFIKLLPEASPEEKKSPTGATAR